jgi:hypothetical protein
MWRTYVICVLVGLLIAAVVGSSVLVRQAGSAQADAATLRQRLAAAETTQTALQQQLDQGNPGPRTSPAAGTPGPRTSATPGVPVPTVAAAPSVETVLQQIEDQVSSLRGLTLKSPVPLHFLDQQALERYFVDRFNQDYLPSERETDQKLLNTLGLLNRGDDVVQILLGVLQEQVVGAYNQDEKAMYLLSENGQVGAVEKATFAHEFALALQDQYYDLNTLVPKHPQNDDRSLATQALTQGDAVLLQRMWAQQYMTQDEITQLGQGGADSKLFSAPAYLRDQLLFPYGDGFNFVRQIYQSGGYPAVDDLFRNPPESTAQILHPAKYRNHTVPVQVDLPDLSQGSLGPGWRTINSNVFGELDLRLALTQLTDSTHATSSTSGWAGDRWELLEKDGRQALAMKTVWDSDADARNFLQAFGLGLQNRFSGAKQEEGSATRQALTAATAATEVRRNGSSVLLVISFDRPSAEAIVAALGF